jgi:hypothetical protein
MLFEKVLAALLLLGAPGLTFARVSLDSNFAPEPETLGLIAGAAIAWAIVRWKKRK